jgi:hypothetical protein
MTRIYTKRSDVQNLAEATEQSPLQNIHASSSTHPDFYSIKPEFIFGSKGARADSLTTHFHLEPTSNISGAYTSTQTVCLYGTYWNNSAITVCTEVDTWIHSDEKPH